MKGLFLFLQMVGLIVQVSAQSPDLSEVNYRKADSVAALYPGHSVTNLKVLSDKLTQPLTSDEEKFRSIYYWVCNNIENDYGYYKKNKHKRESIKDPEKLKQWSKKFSVQVFTKLVREHKTVCSGYAYLVKELAYHAGLSCEIIDGYGRTAQANIGGSGVVNHSWNAVRLRGNWYLCDPTWSSGLIDPQQARFVKQFDGSYFLTDPSLFIQSHYPLDSTWILLEKKPELSEFLHNPLVYRGALKHKFYPVSPAAFNSVAKRGEALSFRCTGIAEPAVGRLELHIVRGSDTARYSPEIYRNSEGLYCVDHIFTERGTYIVHGFLGGDHVFTYSVKVLP